MTSLRAVLERLAADDPIRRALAPVLAEPTGTSTAGFPFLAPRAWELFRDGVPHLLAFGERVLEAASALAEDAAASSELSADEKRWVNDGATVVKQVVLTATITAPPD